jgi:hypothetical protein
MRRLKNRKQIEHNETIASHPYHPPASYRTLGLLTGKRTHPHTHSDSRYSNAYTYSVTTYPNPNNDTAWLPDPTRAYR